VFTGDAIDARNAERAGLVARVVPDADVDTAALDLAGRIARHSAAALRLAKRALRGTAPNGGAAALPQAGVLYLNDVMATTDALEGLRSFVEKRRPSWSHA
jgi:2-(1,2-epoxy-1,2-dihydrophenyl)acetyl-CoA isomerase